MTTLRRLARAAGVADVYEAAGRTFQPPDSTLRAVLTALGHACDDEASIVRSLRSLRRRAWARAVDPVAVVWQGAGVPTRVAISAGGGRRPSVALIEEDGATRDLPAPVWGGVADIDGVARRRGTVALPAGLPTGYHRLLVDDGHVAGHCTVIVAPTRAPDVMRDARGWGWMVQAYALRSAASWGHGEFADLGALADWSAGHGADFVLINPVHATAPVLPQQTSPYSPTSRRFANPCYLRIADVEEFAALGDDERPALPPQLAPDSDRIDRDAVWRAKRTVLRELFSRRGPARDAQLAAHRGRGGDALQRFATFCALAEEHGLPFDAWPAPLRDPRHDAVARWAADHDGAVAFHAWLQLLCEEQMRAAQQRARDAGMAIGVIHDLAVGVDPGSADVWSLPDEFARTMAVGAPPDAFNQQGQNWAQPPPVPAAMRATGHRMLREVLSASLAVAGGLRIDHILGLSRLFWIPDGVGPSDGTYVRYPAEELFAVLVLEAHRAGAILIGEDLGTVDARVRRLMRRRGVTGSAVLYFETDDGRWRPAARYPRAALASVTTHDLPTATGWWDGSAVDVRADLGLLDQPREAAARDLAAQQAALLTLLRRQGCLPPGPPDLRERVLAMHRFLASTPCALVAAALWDATGDNRQPNVPGTVDEYPNWRLPLGEPRGGGTRPLLLEDLDRSGAVRDLIAAVAR